MIRIAAFNMDDCPTGVSDCGSGAMMGIIGRIYRGVIPVHVASVKERSLSRVKVEISKAVGGS